MKTEENLAAKRFNAWITKTGLSKVDLADKLKYPRTALYNTMNSGRISPQLAEAIVREFPDTDMNWLLKGDYPGSNTQASMMGEPQTRYEKAANMKSFYEKDLLHAQVRTALALERLAGLFEKFIKVQEGK